ncbi:hypothetical protein SDC9_73144 [bioreactor metagenome]|uniref:Uncharacterized protein n=1 Tax=bioreactor metagenome TaxID=1076179 RepID=A0A644YDR8_9ZZZZ
MRLGTGGDGCRDRRQIERVGTEEGEDDRHDARAGEQQPVVGLEPGCPHHDQPGRVLAGLGDDEQRDGDAQDRADAELRDEQGGHGYPGVHVEGARGARHHGEDAAECHRAEHGVARGEPAAHQVADDDPAGDDRGLDDGSGDGDRERHQHPGEHGLGDRPRHHREQAPDQAGGAE